MVTPVVEPTIQRASDKPSSGSVKTERKLKREYRNTPTTFAEKIQPVRKKHVQRQKRQIEVADRSLLAWLAERAAQ